MGIEPTALEPHFDIFIDENDIISGAKEIVKRLRPSWSNEQLSHKVISILMYILKLIKTYI